MNIDADRATLLEFHCRANYDSESPWARRVLFQRYRQVWLNTSQPETFLSDLAKSMRGEKTIGEIWESDGELAGYVWVTFTDIDGYGLTVAEVRDIAVDSSFQRRGIALAILSHIETLARERGAGLLRSETGVENVASHGLHEKFGFRCDRLQYEKVLDDPSPGLGSR